MSNETLFDEVRGLKLPLGRYVITASGPMGIRGMRDIADVDLMVDDQLFDELGRRYPVAHGRVEVSPRIEAFRESAFAPDPTVPSLAEQIARADIIDGLPFVALDDLVKLKSAKGREKDLRDIELIRRWLAD